MRLSILTKGLKCCREKIFIFRAMKLKNVLVSTKNFVANFYLFFCPNIEVAIKRVAVSLCPLTTIWLVILPLHFFANKGFSVFSPLVKKLNIFEDINKCAQLTDKKKVNLKRKKLENFVCLSRANYGDFLSQLRLRSVSSKKR
jgi:hypothetical protein